VALRFAVVDSGPLYAAVDRDDQDHHRCLEVLRQPELRLVIPAMVLAEASYLVGNRLGSKVEAQFLAGLEELDVQAPTTEDWRRMSALVQRYANLGLGGVDASVIAMAERLRTDLVVTLDQQRFAAVQPRHCRSLRLLPEADE
jgi:predicted nucleic acid-binding protein